MFETDGPLEGVIVLIGATLLIVFLLALGGAGTFGGLVLP